MTNAPLKIKNKPAKIISVLFASGIFTSLMSPLCLAAALPVKTTTTTSTATKTATPPASVSAKPAAVSQPKKHKKHRHHKKHPAGPHYNSHSYSLLMQSASAQRLNQHVSATTVSHPAATTSEHSKQWNWRFWQGKGWCPVFSLAGGASQSSDVGSGSPNFSATADPVSGQYYYYNSRQPSQTAGLLDVFAGMEWNFHPNWYWQTGVAYDQSSYHAYGTLTQGTNLTTQFVTPYRYDVTNRQVLFENKLLATVDDTIHPYALLGAGVSFNYASNYTVFVPNPLPTRSFGDNTNTAFTYNAGLGIDVDMNSNLRIGMGYRFSDLGKVKLGGSSILGRGVSGTLSTSHTYTSEVIGQFTWALA